MLGEARPTASAAPVAPIRGAGRPRPTGVTRGFSGLLSGAVMLFDVIAVVALLYYFAVERTGGFASAYVTLAATTAVLMPIIYRANDVSHRMRLGGWLLESSVLLRAWLITLMFLVTLSFLTKSTETFSREALLKWVVASYFAQVTIHGVIRFALSRLRSRGLNVRYAVVVGRGAGLDDFIELMQRNRWIGINLVGTIDFNELEKQYPEDAHDKLALSQRAWNSLDQLLASRAVDTIYFALPANDVWGMEALAERLAGEAIEINWVPDLSSLLLLNSSVRELEGQPIICLSDSPLSGGRAFLKRVEDIVLGILFLIPAIPLMLIVAAAILLTNGPPILFRQRRGGLYGRPIEVWKFRTMHVHDEPAGCVRQAGRGDPRVTKLGAFLRRSSLDELPQLLHVVTGRMSLVGPRPHALEHDEQYGELVDRYLLRYKIKPGITGWAQVNGWRGETDLVDKMEMRVAYDLYYIRHWSIALDIRVIWMTLTRILGDARAY
jgi:putative colanic acid biosysnthesis UDP-glucose lipid carrier transferase